MQTHVENRLGAKTRAAQHDLGLSTREAAAYGEAVGLALRDLAAHKAPTPSLATEVGLALGQRVGIPPGTRSLLISTNTPLCQPDPLDIAIAKRDLTAGTNSAGGYLRATDNISFIELLRNRMVCFQLGATRLSGLVGNVTIPKQTAGATAYWLSTEATAITEGNQTFGQVSMTPRTVGAYTQVSRLLRLQSSPAVDSLVLTDLAKQVAIAADLACLSGTGTEQPTGITGTSGIGAVTGTNLAAAGIIEFQTDIASSNAMGGSLGYVTTPAVAGLLKARPELPTTGTTPLWQGNINDGTLFGIRAMTSAQMAAGTMLFGDWSQLVIGEWGVLELSVNEFDDFPKALTGLRAMYTMDCAVRTPAAFSYASSIT